MLPFPDVEKDSIFIAFSERGEQRPLRNDNKTPPPVR